jgi:hypothetical protein
MKFRLSNWGIGFRLAARSAAFAAMVLIALFTTDLRAGELARTFAEHNPLSARVIDHSTWQALLKKYLYKDKTGLNRFRYDRVGKADRRRLKSYIAGLAAANPSALRRNEQYAYWINLYNALTVAVVIDHYPVKSIRDIAISPGLFAKGPWGRKLLKVNGKALSLDNIEHDILRAIWRDKRVHYAVNCASVGCPNLAARAYTGRTIEVMLERAAYAYINHARGVKVSSRGLILSSLYKWYAGDFGNKAALFAHLARYASPALKRQLEITPAITGYAYDWRLNN